VRGLESVFLKCFSHEKSCVTPDWSAQETPGIFLYSVFVFSFLRELVVIFILLHVKEPLGGETAPPAGRPGVPRGAGAGAGPRARAAAAGGAGGDGTAGLWGHGQKTVL